MNNTMALMGNYAARLDVSQDTHSYIGGTPITFGHQTLRQLFPPNTFFGNVTSRPDSVSFWYKIQPKFSGYTGLELRIKANDTTEMDYIFANPVIGIGITNSSTGGEAGKPVKYIIIPTPTMNQWAHLSRDLKHDWLAPMTDSSGNTIPGTFNLSPQSIALIEIWSFYYESPSTMVYGETEWVDNVAIYADSPNPPPPPPPSNYYAAFSFQDANSGAVDNLVKWKLFNSTEQEVVGYSQNSPTLPLEPYTINVYYPVITGQDPEPYLISRQRITLNSTFIVHLEMFPQNQFPWSYVAVNNTVTNMKIVKVNSTFLQFNAQGNSGPSLVLVNVQSKPLAVQRNTDDPNSIKWTYDSSLSILRIPAIGLGNFSIFITPPLTIPNIIFQDLSGNNIVTGIAWRIFYPDGTLASFAPGQLVQNGTYTFKAFYEGYPIYTNYLTSTPNPVPLQLFPIPNQQKIYIAFNSTISTVTILENSSTKLQFRSAGAGPSLIIVNVPSKPLNVQIDGTTITSWNYNSTTSTIAIQTSQLGTFTVTYSNPPPTIPLLYVGALIGAIALAASGLLVWERARSRKPVQPSLAEEKPATKNETKTKAKAPRSNLQGRT